MIKRTDVGGTNYDWMVLDSQRNLFNVSNNFLTTNTSNSENVLSGGSTFTDINVDFVSSGFKIRNVYLAQNASGGTYIFAAFAEAPFKYARAR